MTQDIGRFMIEQELGRGSFGTVYRATDSILQVTRAVKVLHPILLSDPSIVKHFMSEAQLLAGLKHANIVTVYDVLNEDGRLCIVMDYLSGGSLAERLHDKGALTLAQALPVLKRVAAALDYAHGRGIIHCDLKPQNVLFDEAGNAQLSDFGLAMAVAGESGSLSSTRSSAGLSGTLAYMAPELWDGAKPTAASDVYALACTAYEMLTGKVLFDGSTPMAVLKRHMAGPQLEAIADARVRDVLRETLTADPAQRLGATEMVRRLEEMTLPPVIVPAEEPNKREPLPGPVPSDQSDEHHESERDGRLVQWLPWVAGSITIIALIIAVVLVAYTRSGSRATAAQIGVTDVSTPTPVVMEVLSSQPVDCLDVERDASGKVKRIGRGTLNQLAWTPDGKSIAVASSIGVYLYDAQTFSVQRCITSSVTVDSVTFSPDGTLLATGSIDGTARVWRMSDGSLVRTLTGYTNGARSVAFSPDGTLLATGSGATPTRVWRVSDGTLVRTGYTDSALSVAFSPDGVFLATGSLDKSARIWRVDDGTLVRTLSGHTWGVTSVAYSLDGVFLATGGSFDNTARLWRVSDGTLVRNLTGHTSYVNSVAFSPDGMQLVTGSQDGTVRFWDVPK